MGPQEQATLETLTRFRDEGRLEGREALTELALGLSRQLDAGGLGNSMAIPQLSKELRATLLELGKPHDSVGDEAEQWLERLSSPVVDPED